MQSPLVARAEKGAAGTYIVFGIEVGAQVGEALDRAGVALEAGVVEAGAPELFARRTPPRNPRRRHTTPPPARNHTRQKNT